MYQLNPLNKYVVIETIDEANKVGSLFIPATTRNQYRLGRVIAFDSCDETKKLLVGQTVLYDTLGAVDHRVGNQTMTTVKVMNLVGIVTVSDS